MRAPAASRGIQTSRARRSRRGAPQLPAPLTVDHSRQSREGGEGAGPAGAAARSLSCANPIGSDVAGGVVPSKKVAIGATATTAAAASADIVVRVGFGGGGDRAATKVLPIPPAPPLGRHAPMRSMVQSQSRPGAREDADKGRRA